MASYGMREEARSWRRQFDSSRNQLGYLTVLARTCGGSGLPIRLPALLLLLVVVLALATLPAAASAAHPAAVQRYIVVFAGHRTSAGSFALGGDYALNHQTALALVHSAGGTVTADLSHQIGVMIVELPNALFAEVLRSAALVEEVGNDFHWKAFPTYEEALASGELVPFSAPRSSAGASSGTEDPFEPLQWSMQQIRAPAAHMVQVGARTVDVGILDSGIDVTHAEFLVGPTGMSPNVDLPRARDFTFVGTQNPHTDPAGHGTAVAGVVAAQANGLGIVGVAPNVTLVPVKVCDATGYCYVSAVVQGITYAGDIQLDVINMSFAVNDDALFESHIYKCANDPTQQAFRKAVARAIQYARSRGVTPIGGLGNDDYDLAHPPAPYDDSCDIVPAETPGVIGLTALGPSSEKASYSNYGWGAADVAAPGGEFPNSDNLDSGCGPLILTTVPVAHGSYGCAIGASFAAPHASGVAALIVSQFGTLGADGDMKMAPSRVEAYLQASAIDIGLLKGADPASYPPDTLDPATGYDECFGNGRIDALRAVQHDTSYLSEPTLFCPGYNQ